MEYCLALFATFVIVFLQAPVHSQQERTLQFSTYEELDAATFIGDIATGTGLYEQYESDIIENVRFSILPQSNKHHEFFMVQETDGILRVAQKVDREAVCPQLVICRFNLKVALLFSPSQAEIINVVIQIDDINDSEPQFLQPAITRTIQENTAVGYSISITTARDMDSPQFGIDRYVLRQGSSAFGLKAEDNSNLYLVLKKPIDREQKDKYVVMVSALDKGSPPKSGLLTVDINILDANDNSPQFENDVYNITLPENARLGKILQVKATDKDLGQNGDVVYEFDAETNQSYGGLFQLNKMTGEMFLVDELDYEMVETYTLIISAKDKATESLSSKTKVIVKITDVNDHSPEITVSSLSVTKRMEISEGARPGDNVAFVSAEDKDSENNGKFSCSIKGDVFSLKRYSPTEYMLVTANRLDREIQDVHRVAISCVDRGDPQLTSTEMVTVTIMDENDNYPVFTESIYTATLEEGNQIGASITQVKATDLDIGENGNVNYFVDERDSDVIYVDKTTGMVSARAIFNFEKMKNLSFTIYAKDGGKLSSISNATLILKITDKNDESPKFTSRIYNFTVYENQPAGTLLGKLSASDADTEPHNQFYFSLKPDNAINSIFSVESRGGKLFTRTALDREVKAKYEFIAVVIDKAIPTLTSTALVMVTVEDVNDNPPAFYFPSKENNTMHVSNRIPKGTSILDVLAHDKDAGQNGSIFYVITKGNEEGVFELETKTGCLTTQIDLQDIGDKAFHLEIMARDDGKSPLFTKTALNIIVNSSLLLDSSLSDPSAGYNLTILIAVAAASAAVIFILLTAIVIVKRQGSCRSQKNYSDKIMIDPALYGSQKAKSCPKKTRYPADVNSAVVSSGDNKKEVSFNSEIRIDNETVPADSDELKYYMQKVCNQGGDVRSSRAKVSRRSPTVPDPTLSAGDRVLLDSKHFLYYRDLLPQGPAKLGQGHHCCRQDSASQNQDSRDGDDGNDVDSISVQSERSSVSDSGRGSNPDSPSWPGSLESGLFIISPGNMSPRHQAHSVNERQANKSQYWNRYHGCYPRTVVDSDQPCTGCLHSDPQSGQDNTAVDLPKTNRTANKTVAQNTSTPTQLTFDNIASHNQNRPSLEFDGSWEDGSSYKGSSRV